MNQLILIVGSEEYRLKATTAAIEEAEKRLGFSLLTALENIDRVACFAAILWAGLQKFHHGMTMQRAYSLIDDIIEKGCSFNGKEYPGTGIEVRAELALEVLKVSGFFTPQQIEAMEAAIPASNGITTA